MKAVHGFGPCTTLIWSSPDAVFQVSACRSRLMVCTFWAEGGWRWPLALAGRVDMLQSCRNNRGTRYYQQQDHCRRRLLRVVPFPYTQHSGPLKPKQTLKPKQRCQHASAQTNHVQAETPVRSDTRTRLEQALMRNAQTQAPEYTSDSQGLCCEPLPGPRMYIE